MLILNGLQREALVSDRIEGVSDGKRQSRPGHVAEQPGYEIVEEKFELWPASIVGE